jgi:organic radical activating enzyme
VIFESLTGSCPWNSHNITSLMQEIKKCKNIFPKNVNIPDYWREIINEMISFEPQKRPSCKILK